MQRGGPSKKRVQPTPPASVGPDQPTPIMVMFVADRCRGGEINAP
jgi:hypothetical protein